MSTNSSTFLLTSHAQGYPPPDFKSEVKKQFEGKIKKIIDAKKTVEIEESKRLAPIRKLVLEMRAKQLEQSIDKKVKKIAGEYYKDRICFSRSGLKEDLEKKLSTKSLRKDPKIGILGSLVIDECVKAEQAGEDLEIRKVAHVMRGFAIKECGVKSGVEAIEVDKKFQKDWAKPILELENKVLVKHIKTHPSVCPLIDWDESRGDSIHEDVQSESTPTPTEIPSDSTRSFLAF